MQLTPYEEANKVTEFNFKEPEGKRVNTAWSGLVKGVGDLFNEGVKALDSATKLTIDDQVSSDVNYAKQQNIREYKEILGNTLAASETASQSPQGASTGLTANAQVSGLGNGVELAQGLPNGNKGIPAQIGIGLRDMDKMNQAMNQGQFDSERFYGEIQSRTANLVTRYPGYSDYIQQKVTHFLGTDPANAQREALQQTLRQLIGGKQDAGDKWITEVQTHYAPVMGGPWTMNALNEQDPGKRNILRAQAAVRLTSQSELKLAHAQVKADLDNNTLDENSKKNLATRSMDMEFGNLLSNMQMAGAGWTGTYPEIQAHLRTQRETGVIDVEGNAQRALAFGGAHQSYKAWFEREWIKPQFNQDPETGKYLDSYSSLIKDPAFKEQLMKKYDTVANSIKDDIGAGLFNLATYKTDKSSQKLNNAVADAYNKEAVLGIAVVNKTLGQFADKVIGSADTASNFGLSTGLGAQLLESAKINNIVKGTAGGNNLGNQVQVIGEAIRSDPRTADKGIPTHVYRGLLDNLTEVFRHPGEVPLQARVNAAEVISHPSTPAILDHFSKDQQFLAYGNLFAPDVTAFIKNNMADEVWKRYKDTSGRVFIQMFGTLAGDVNKYVTQDVQGKFEWNPATQQIVYTPRIPKGSRVSGDKAIDPAEAVVARVNEGLRTIATTLEGDKEKITPEYLKALGINLDAPNRSPTMDAIIKSMRYIKPMNPETSKGDKPISNTNTHENNNLQTGFRTITDQEMESHLERPLMVDRKLIIDPEQKKSILQGVQVDSEGMHWLIKGNRMHPVSL